MIIISMNIWNFHCKNWRIARSSFAFNGQYIKLIK